MYICRGKKRKEKEIENEQQKIPVSTERYVEVVPNLKDLLNSCASTPFSLSEKFGNIADYDTENSLTFSFSNKEVSQPNEKSPKDNLKTVIPQHTNNIFENKKKIFIFISENDDILKEGVEFFQRKNTLEQLQNDWNRKKNMMLWNYLEEKGSLSKEGLQLELKLVKRTKLLQKNKS
ncbi:uncharacterized protein CEXT_171161 [Caerostris extrusa]|uniref:Uncharacterized protein n=1 Tax=Caerostris extrusa TaxID=172846 RepID=A0AAV4NIS6_CAEEX|nr:uncharacterized protein CEXT_171161 [Caerostris extrusa]